MKVHPEAMSFTEYILEWCESCWDKLGPVMDGFYRTLVQITYAGVMGNHMPNIKGVTKGDLQCAIG